MPRLDELASLSLHRPIPLERLAQSMGQRYGNLYKSLVRASQWSEVRLDLELRGADFLAIPIPGRHGILGFHLMTTAPTRLRHEQLILGAAAGRALQALMLPYVPAVPGHDSNAVRSLRRVTPIHQREGVMLSEGWARIERSVLA